MSKGKYPRITRFKPYRGHPKGHPPCPICGRPATGSIEIQTSYMRGEDEYRPRCEEHRHDMTLRPPPVELDDDGFSVRAGDRIEFRYGIPPVRVVAMLTVIGGKLWALTPGHQPDRCILSELRGHVGPFDLEKT